MRAIVPSLIWQTWRMSRRWFLLVLPVTLFIGWLALNVKPPPGVGMDLRVFRMVAAQGAVVEIFAFACICTLLAISMGNKNGFPFSFEYRMPVSSITLVTVPILFLAVLCASLYFIPLVIYRFVYDIPFPLLSGTVLILNIVMFILCGTWITTSNSTRGIAVTFAIVCSILLFIGLMPVHMIQPRPGVDLMVFNRDIISLDGFDYLLLMVISAALIAVTVSFIGRLRQGEPAWFGRRAGKGGKSSSQAGEEANNLGDALSGPTRLERLSDRFAFACPIIRPWLAECWVEYHRFVIPVLVFSVTFAVLAPLLILLGVVAEWKPVVEIANGSPVTLYFIGIGLSLFNRRLADGGYMNVFEGSRAMSTPKLAAIQIGVIAVASGIGIAILNVSLDLSLPMAAELGEPDIGIPDLLAPVIEPTFMTSLTGLVVFLVAYVGIIAMFSSLHSCSVFWGKKFMIGVMLFAFFAINMVVRIRLGRVEMQGIVNLVWGVSIAVDLVTLAAVIRVFQLRIISLQTGMLLFAGWLVFFVCAWFNMVQRGYDFSRIPSEVQAFNMALVLLPVTFAALTLWCYDRLRHT